MRKLLLIGALVLIAAAAFAQDAPKTNYEIYGATNFDYQITGTELDATPVGWSNFTFTKLRLGLRAQLPDGVKSYLEFDPRNGEFRLAYIDWLPLPGLTLSAGKFNTTFEQLIPVVGGSRMYLLGAKYAVPGLGWAGLQIGNKSDIGFLSGNWLVYPPTDGAKTTAATVKQDKDIYVFPTIAFKPNLGKDVSLEVGVESQLDYTQMTSWPRSGASIGTYGKASAFGFDFATEVVWLNLNNEDKEKTDISAFAQVTYNIDKFSPTIYLVGDLLNYTTHQGLTLGIELPYKLTSNLKVIPLFSYAISGSNIQEGNYVLAGVPFYSSNGNTRYYQEHDWTFGIRIDYSYSIKW